MNNCDLYKFSPIVALKLKRLDTWFRKPCKILVGKLLDKRLDIWLRKPCKILVGKLLDKWPYFEDCEVGEDKIKMNHRKIPNHHPASFALITVIAVCTETLLKIIRLIQAMKSYRWEFRHGLFPMIIKIWVSYCMLKMYYDGNGTLLVLVDVPYCASHKCATPWMAVVISAECHHLFSSNNQNLCILHILPLNVSFAPCSKLINRTKSWNRLTNIKYW